MPDCEYCEKTMIVNQAVVAAIDNPDCFTESQLRTMQRRVKE